VLHPVRGVEREKGTQNRKIGLLTRPSACLTQLQRPKTLNTPMSKNAEALKSMPPADRDPQGESLDTEQVNVFSNATSHLCCATQCGCKADLDPPTRLEAVPGLAR
jgi:hypothetical protein